MCPDRLQLQVDGGGGEQPGDGEGDHPVDEIAGERRGAEEHCQGGRTGEDAERCPAGVFFEIPETVRDKTEEHEPEHQFGHADDEKRVASEMPDVGFPHTEGHEAGESSGQTGK